MKRIVSGIQPSGKLHLGNYLGAIRNWVDLQSSNQECFFGVMDLHAITVPQKSKDLSDSVKLTVATLVACGIDPLKSCIFNQSGISVHSELAWILSCNTPMGWLNRMTQFKEKTGNNKDTAVLGLYAYPVLMAADILSYKATHIPVGEDQTQHVQLTRDIAGAFNRNYGVDYFKMPEALIMPKCARVMSLRDATKKMSKSEASDYSRINLTDTADVISDKIRKAKSDSLIGIAFDNDRPEASNLLEIYATLNGLTNEEAENECSGMNFSTFKQILIDILVEKFTPISNEINKVLETPHYINSVLVNGNERASEIAEKTLSEIKNIVGL